MCDEERVHFNDTSNTSIFHNNLSLSCPQATSDDLDVLQLSSFLLEGVTHFCLSIIGVLGNTTSIFLLTRRSLNNFFNKLLVWLAVFDLLFCFTMLLESLSRMGIESYFQLMLFPHFLYPLGAISMTGSIYMTMAVSLERYIAIRQPISRLPKQFSMVAINDSFYNKRLLKYVVPIAAFAITFNIPKFLESQLKFKDGKVYVEVTNLRMSKLYVTWYHNWTRLLMLGFLPFISICYLNYRIYTIVRRTRKFAQSKKEDNLSGVLLVIIISFLICNTLRILLSLHEIYVVDIIYVCRCSNLGGFPVWILILGFISRIFLVLNSSTNLLIYCIFGKKFRTVLSSYLCCD